MADNKNKPASRDKKLKQLLDTIAKKKAIEEAEVELERANRILKNPKIA